MYLKFDRDFFQIKKLLNLVEPGLHLRKTTESALCEFQARIVAAVDNNVSVVEFFLDFSHVY